MKTDSSLVSKVLALKKILARGKTINLRKLSVFIRPCWWRAKKPCMEIRGVYNRIPIFLLLGDIALILN